MATGAGIAVLLVDADSGDAGLLRAYLEDHGCELDCATSLAQARFLAQARQTERRGEHEMVVVDLELPDGDGLELCRSLREHSCVPIIVTRAQAAPWHSVMALDAGADDFVAKPVVPAELLARIHARIRRRRGQLGANEGRVELDDLRLLRDRGEVFVAQERVRLTAAEFHVLWTLAVRAGSVLSRDELALGTELSPRSVDVHVSRIRAKLGDIAGGLGSVPPIRSVRGVGYVLSGLPLGKS